MPNLNVRLSEEQHEELRKAVYERGRHWSLQKEIIERLFWSAKQHLIAEARQPITAAARPSHPLDARGIALDAEQGKSEVH